jgi:CubicO group peptidase (beta-lactamase class C family)
LKPEVLQDLKILIMKRPAIFFSLWLVFISTCLSAQYLEENSKLDEFIRRGMEEWKVPGLAAVVVKDGRVVFTGTYGVRNIDTGEKVDRQTLFAMASTSKAVTAIAMGMLVDRGLISWDDKVYDHIPEFRLSEPCLTDEARIRDLFTHNLGIAAPGALYMYELTAAELIEKCACIEKEFPLRAGFVYNNTMYALAGEVINRVSGISWENFVKENILDPLGMTRTLTIASLIESHSNSVASHYDHFEEGIVRTWSYLPESYNAAGGLCSCIDDMGRYLVFLLNGGVVNGDTLLTPGTFKELFTPQTLIRDMDDFYPTHQLTNPDWVSYGLGWFQHDYRGTKVDFHTGSLDGLVAISGLIHDLKLGVYLFANLDHAELRHAVMYRVFDLYGFGDYDRDWHREVFDLYSGIKEKRLKAIRERDSSRKEDAPLSVSLEACTGTYTHPMGGKVVVAVEGDTLKIHINDLFHISATHWHYNTFMTSREKPFFEGVLIQFELNPVGEVEGLNLYGLDFSKISS